MSAQSQATAQQGLPEDRQVSQPADDWPRLKGDGAAVRPVRARSSTLAWATPELPPAQATPPVSTLAQVTALLLHQQTVSQPAAEVQRPRRIFPYQEFASNLDPGTVKARYLVGPIDPTIVYVGDLDDRHAPDLLVRAMPSILKKQPQARLVIVGDGDLLWPLRVMSRYMLLDHAIRIVGHVGGREVCELIAACDVVAIPSREQTEDWQILSGWSARRPVVATHPVSGELCRHEEDSVLIDPRAADCAAGIERVLSDPDLGRHIARRGYQRVVAEFGEPVPQTKAEELQA